MISKLFANLGLRERAIDASLKRNEAIAQNMANIDTPGYKRKTVQFESLLDHSSGKALPGRTAHKRHIKINGSTYAEARIGTDHASLETRLDGNNVDIENETAHMAKNAIKYNTLIQDINSKFRRLKSAISEGRR